MYISHLFAQAIFHARELELNDGKWNNTTIISLQTNYYLIYNAKLWIRDRLSLFFFFTAHAFYSIYIKTVQLIMCFDSMEIVIINSLNHNNKILCFFFKDIIIVDRYWLYNW